jgi:phage terminase large subunit
VTTATVELPPKLVPLFGQPRGALRYRCAKGGRGSGKSFSFALMAAIWGYAEPLRILATRELQISIKESFHAEVKNAIESLPWLAAHYEVGESYVRGNNGTEFIFRGLRHNISAIKSMAQIDLCIVEEAEDVPEASWRDLLPTIRTPRSEIWCVWNPRLDGSPVDQRFVKAPPSDALVVDMNYHDNPWFPAVLDAQRLHDQRTLDPATYAHIWEGAYLQNSDAQVLAGKVSVQEFVPGEGWDGPYHGMDYGFAQDPTTAVKCWVHQRKVYVEYEAGKIGLEIDQTAEFIKRGIPGIENYTIRADSARPESTSYLHRHGLPRIESVHKWPNSVEDGVAHLRSYDQIIIHPRCKETIRETRLYSYKVDRLSGDILPEIVDSNNHYMDSLRYALSPLIRRRDAGGAGIKVQGL